MVTRRLLAGLTSRIDAIEAAMVPGPAPAPIRLGRKHPIGVANAPMGCSQSVYLGAPQALMRADICVRVNVPGGPEPIIDTCAQIKSP